ncbi:cell cycle arrest in response to pheromone-like protein [Ceratobasidium theobromae]|uniref:Cell cycle arrest in response to pheromone-like protein n=1 Tax=Ceratobasidium theobromae TaxID=1582974 RepID=A0A5N5QMC9_9AGAM|nr:cell cycle arrest in response to pheromone-like protein [Ceratobasidium theobromae]
MAPYQMQPPPACPALYLYPLNDTFVPKQIALGGGVRVKIGRQTNAKTVPGERNGYFDSKVLSRQHAEVWEEGGKVRFSFFFLALANPHQIYIKDVKSSNGTFINGDRLSAESVESEPYELKSEDIVEFGIDIVGEDNKTIIHHKVATRVYVVLTPEDAQAAAREHHAHLQHQQQALFAQQHQHQQHAAQQAQAIARRQQGPLSGNNSQLGGLGGLGQGQTRPGSKGLSFDHILNKLQIELQKSRDTGAELHTLTTAMNDIQETMGGGAIPPPPPQHQLIPPVRQPTAEADVSAMQSQLRETQSSLQAHVDKIRALDRLVEEHEAIKREVGTMREMLTRARSPLQLEEGDLGEHGGNLLGERAITRRGEYDDDSDTRSVCTIVPEDEEQADARERRSVGRPKTPEPMAIMDEANHQPEHALSSADRDAIRTAEQNALHAAEQNAILAARLEALTTQLEQAITLSQGLQTHAERASNTIAALEAKVVALEEEQRATRILGGQTRSEEPGADIAQAVKSELMREMERRWEAWRAHTEEEHEAEKRNLAATLEQFRAVMDGRSDAPRPAESEPAAVKALEGDVEALKTRLGDVEAFGTRIGQVEIRVADVGDLCAQVEKMGARVDEVGTRVDSVDARVGDVDARVGELDSLVGRVGTRVTEAEDQLGDARAQLQELRRDGRTRADAVRAISGLPSDSSSSTLDAMQSSASTLEVRKRVRKRSSRGSSGEDNSSLASSMTRASVSTRATSPSEDECDEEDDTRRVDRLVPPKPALAVSPAGQTETGDGGTVSKTGPGTTMIKDVPAPVLSAAAVAVVAIGLGAWMLTHRGKD